MLSGDEPCHLSDELLTVFLQHHSLLATLIVKKEASSVSDYWCHIFFTLYIPSFKLFQNSTVDGCSFFGRIKKRVEASSYDITVAKHVEIYWTPDSVLCMWCFNGNMNSSP